MRTLYPVLIVIAIGMASIMWSMSGFGLLFGNDDPVSDLESEDRLNQSAQNLEEDESLEVSDQGRDSFVGSVISAGEQMIGFAKSAVLLPAELQRIGLPPWMAIPLGLGAQSIAFIGFLQFLTGRIYE